MKKFLLKLLLFSLPFVVLVLAMDSWLRNVDSLYKEKFQGIQRAKDTQILILGNSHANYGVDPGSFSLPAYNLANPNQSLYFDKRLVQKLLPSLPKLKYVLISIDYHSLYFSSQGIRDVWSYYANGIAYKNRNYYLENISPFLFGYTPGVSISMLKKQLLKNIHNKDHKLIQFEVQEGVNLTDNIVNGYLGFEGVDEKSFNPGYYSERIAGFNQKIKNSTERLEIIQDLTEFLSVLKSRNIIPVFFSTPVYVEFYKYADKHTLLQNKKDINAICRKLQLQYFDYSDGSLFNKSDFYDCDHLNKQGARTFSRIVNEKLNIFQNSHQN
ncbi:MAG: D-alanyl-lipoteichoic acid biosynthesis protein DltD [Paludibacter sp.]